MITIIMVINEYNQNMKTAPVLSQWFRSDLQVGDNI
jgi:hypothetical protein